MRKLFPLLTLGCLLTVQSHAGIDIATELRNAASDKKAGEADAGQPAPKAAQPEKALSITLRNTSNKPETGLTVRYWYFGRNMKTNKLDPIGGGEHPVSLKPNGSEVVTGSNVQGNYVPQMFLKKPAAPAAAPKPGETAGPIKVSGYGVQVIRESKVVSEYFTEPGLKTLVGAEGNQPGNVFTPKESDADKGDKK